MYDNFFIRTGLLWTGKVYSTIDTSYFSHEKWNDEFMTCDEMFDKRWKQYGYILDNLKRLRPGPTTPTVDFGELFETLRSSDESLLEKNA